MKLSGYKKKNLVLRKATLCFLIKDDKVLLAMKKRGFGKGRWNGVGGKPAEGESIEQAAVREAKEEINISAKNLETKAVLNFYFPPNPEWDQQVIVFIVKEWEGKPEESEEMSPKWFRKDKLPLESMWPDDKYWLPDVLDGKEVEADFLFGENDKLLEYNLATH